ncbi:hypothetical protein HLB44_36610 [Aquincola sp. S2]|uniref:Uncharacterized protein n=1 Tax=Pseudaquabacterium terrae TaxID=2732868 RepID=A0ABX2EUQ4_9BURK|nr:hypothetical protein [Aquabacterium terrae]NRF72482.1 hypothetical protein [Aquabacterium terrae]
MAIWQFDLTFVPIGDPMPVQGPDGHEARSFRAHKVSAAKAWLSERFGAPREVLEDWFIYGPNDGSRVDLLFNPDGSAEISARIDARSEAVEFATALCELSALVDGQPFSVEFWKLLEVKPSAIGLALERSRAAAFIRDPEKVLRGAGSGA